MPAPMPPIPDLRSNVNPFAAAAGIVRQAGETRRAEARQARLDDRERREMEQTLRAEEAERQMTQAARANLARLSTEFSDAKGPAQRLARFIEARSLFSPNDARTAQDRANLSLLRLTDPAIRGAMDQLNEEARTPMYQFGKNRYALDDLPNLLGSPGAEGAAARQMFNQTARDDEKLFLASALKSHGVYLDEESGNLVTKAQYDRIEAERKSDDTLWATAGGDQMVFDTLKMNQVRQARNLREQMQKADAMRVRMDEVFESLDVSPRLGTPGSADLTGDGESPGAARFHATDHALAAVSEATTGIREITDRAARERVATAFLGLGPSAPFVARELFYAGGDLTKVNFAMSQAQALDAQIMKSGPLVRGFVGEAANMGAYLPRVSEEVGMLTSLGSVREQARASEYLTAAREADVPLANVRSSIESAMTIMASVPDLPVSEVASLTPAEAQRSAQLLASPSSLLSGAGVSSTSLFALRQVSGDVSDSLPDALVLATEYVRRGGDFSAVSGAIEDPGVLDASIISLRFRENPEVRNSASQGGRQLLTWVPSLQVTAPKTIDETLTEQGFVAPKKTEDTANLLGGGGQASGQSGTQSLPDKDKDGRPDTAVPFYNESSKKGLEANLQAGERVIFADTDRQHINQFKQRVLAPLRRAAGGPVPAALVVERYEAAFAQAIQATSDPEAKKRLTLAMHQITDEVFEESAAADAIRIATQDGANLASLGYRVQDGQVTPPGNGPEFARAASLLRVAIREFPAGSPVSSAASQLYSSLMSGAPLSIGPEDQKKMFDQFQRVADTTADRLGRGLMPFDMGADIETEMGSVPFLPDNRARMGMKQIVSGIPRPPAMTGGLLTDILTSDPSPDFAGGRLPRGAAADLHRASIEGDVESILRYRGEALDYLQGIGKTLDQALDAYQVSPKNWKAVDIDLVPEGQDRAFLFTTGAVGDWSGGQRAVSLASPEQVTEFRKQLALATSRINYLFPDRQGK